MPIKGGRNRKLTSLKLHKKTQTAIKKGPQPSFLKYILGIREIRALLVFLAIMIFFTYLTNGKFITLSNASNMLRYVSTFGVMAGGVTVLLISGEIDISTGAVFALSPIIAALLVKSAGFTIWMAAPVAIAIASLCGFINGVVTVKGRIPSFITTIGTMLIYRAFAYILSGGYFITGMPPSLFYFLLGGKLFGVIPSGFIWCVGVTIFLWILLEETAFGNLDTAGGDSFW